MEFFTLNQLHNRVAQSIDLSLSLSLSTEPAQSSLVSPRGNDWVTRLSQIRKSPSQPIAVGESPRQPVFRPAELPVSSATEIASGEYAQHRRGGGILQAASLQHYRQGGGEPGRLPQESQITFQQQRGIQQFQVSRRRRSDEASLADQLGATINSAKVSPDHINHRVAPAERK